MFFVYTVFLFNFSAFLAFTKYRINFVNLWRKTMKQFASLWSPHSTLSYILQRPSSDVRKLLLGRWCPGIATANPRRFGLGRRWLRDRRQRRRRRRRNSRDRRCWNGWRRIPVVPGIRRRRRKRPPGLLNLNLLTHIRYVLQDSRAVERKILRYWDDRLFEGWLSKTHDSGMNIPSRLW